MGRKSKFTAEEKRHFCRLLEQGQYLVELARNCGIGVSTMKNWRAEFYQNGELASKGKRETEVIPLHSNKPLSMSIIRLVPPFLG